MVRGNRTWIERTCAGLWGVAWLAVAALMLMRVTAPAQPGRLDLVAHFAVFGAMTLATISFSRDTARLTLLALVTVAGATALEFAQALVPYRTFELLDLAANTVGATTGYALALVVVGRMIRSAQTASVSRDAALGPAVPSRGQGSASVRLGTAQAGDGPCADPSRINPESRESGHG
jgi:VanZ family protein